MKPFKSIREGNSVEPGVSEINDVPEDPLSFVEIKPKKTKVVKEKGRDIIQYIDREIVKKEEIVKFVENCPIPKDIIDAHNAAATLNKATEVKK